MSTSDRRGAAIEAGALALVALVVYWVTGPSASGDMWPPLADAFLSGRLHIDDRPWLELVPRPGGGQYVPLPPVPALTLIPVALLTGAGTPFGELDGNVYASVVGAANVGLAYWLLLGWGVAPSSRRWLTIGFAFTTHWWVAGMAGPHHFAEICAVAFLLACLNLAMRGRAPLAAGLLLGLAAGCRLPAGLALPVVAVLYARSDRGAGLAMDRRQLLVLAGVAAVAVPIAAYNLARFGSPFDFGYAHIPSGESGLITDEPWFSEGLLSISYIPRHLKVMFVDTFTLVGEAPFLRPSWSGASLLVTTPFLFGALAARGRIVPWLWIGVGLVMLPDLLWGSWGFAQFGYRRILDAMPIILLLLGVAFRERIGWPMRAAVLAGIAVHAYGIWAINVLGFVG